MARQETRKIPSAIPIYLCAGIWILYAFVRPLYGLTDLLICAVLSAIAYFVARRCIKPRIVTVEIPVDTGDAEINRQIAEGRAAIRQIREANAALPDDVISARLDRMTVSGDGIFDELEKHTGKASQVRRFMNYYLPTTVKLLDTYRAIEQAPGENAQYTRKRIEDSLEMIAAAFEKLHNDLYGETSIDVTSEIQALETILVSEGLKQSEPIT